MAEAKKPVREKLISPKGIAVYPHLTQPDTRFSNGGAGHYTVRLRFQQADVEEFIADLDRRVDEEFAKAVEENGGKTFKIVKGKKTEFVRKEPYTVVLDDNTGDPTGEVEVIFKMKAEYTDKKGVTHKLKPTLVDGKGQVIKGAISIWGGSILKVEYVPQTYNSTVGIGVTCYLNAVQIIKLQSGGGASHSFGADEDAEYEYEADSDDSGSSFSEESDYEPGAEDTPDF